MKCEARKVIGWLRIFFFLNFTYTFTELYFLEKPIGGGGEVVEPLLDDDPSSVTTDLVDELEHDESMSGGGFGMVNPPYYFVKKANRSRSCDTCQNLDEAFFAKLDAKEVFFSNPLASSASFGTSTPLATFTLCTVRNKLVASFSDRRKFFYVLAY